MQQTQDVAGSKPWLPIDFHSHGVGKFDFTEIPEVSLDAIERSLREEDAKSILTLYLPRPHLGSLIALLDAFNAGWASGRYTNVLGIALEGPVLSSHGGTPSLTIWNPARDEWRVIAALGKMGLRYVVLSPDSLWDEDGIGRHASPGVPWIVETLMDGGVLPALGHMRKGDASQCGDRIRQVLEIVARRKSGPIVTDHLYNDMPLSFCHAWRTAASRQTRVRDLEKLDLLSWTTANIEDKAGPVPAAILDGAARGLIRPCINFDGEHVDLAISTRTVELFGADKFLLMTDRIQSRRLAGQRLSKRPDNTLLYQEAGIVAGGSQGPHQQIHNLRLWGVPENHIRMLAFENAAKLLGLDETFAAKDVAHAS